MEKAQADGAGESGNSIILFPNENALSCSHLEIVFSARKPHPKQGAPGGAEYRPIPHSETMGLFLARERLDRHGHEGNQVQRHASQRAVQRHIHLS